MFKVSICVPIFNVSQYIERCARSIFEQTYQDWEAIFVDDCSPDDSVEVLERVLLDYPELKDKVRIVHHGHNRGLAAARNTGVDAAKGEFIMHVDSDDWLEPNALEVLVKRQQETNADIVSGNAIRHRKTGDDLLTDPEYSNSHEMTMEMVELSLDHVIWRRLIRRSLYTDNNIHAIEGVNIGEDHHTLPRLTFFAKNVERVDAVVCHYNCMNENSLMSQKGESAFNYKRYSNDRDSCKILLNFFRDRDEEVYNHTRKIYKRYLSNFYASTAVTGDWKAYKIVVQDMGYNPWHFKIFFHFMNIRTKFIFKGIVDRIFGDSFYLKMHAFKQMVKL